MALLKAVEVILDRMRKGVERTRASFDRNRIKETEVPISLEDALGKLPKGEQEAIEKRTKELVGEEEEKRNFLVEILTEGVDALFNGRWEDFSFFGDEIDLLDETGKDSERLRKLYPDFFVHCRVQCPKEKRCFCPKDGSCDPKKGFEPLIDRIKKDVFELLEDLKSNA